MTNHPMIAHGQFALATLVLCAAVALGGGQGTLGDSLVQLLSLGLLALALWRHATDPLARLPAWAWLAALPLLLPLAQMLPVPDALWGLPAARDAIAAEAATAGVPTSPRLGLVALGAERTLAWMLPALALFLAGLQQTAPQRARLVAVFVALACVGAVLGLAQLAGGNDSPLRFYTITNTGSAVGFFANRNHHASFMAMALPFVLVGTAWWMNQRREADAGQALWLVAGIGLAALLIAGIAIASSRAGLVLGMLAIALAVPAVLQVRRRAGTRRVLAIALAVGLTLGVQFGLLGVLQHFQRDPLQDNRFHTTPIVLEAARAHAPLGAGLGSFRQVFETFEGPVNDSEYVNHAHNDAAELWLEGGWLAVLLAVPLLGAFAVAGWRAWQNAPSPSPAVRILRQAAWIALLLVLLHSLVDYPLRTTSHLALFGLLAAFASRPPQDKRAIPCP
ncbi:MAG: O-antigen ligase family protein [Arenimonas sp.]|nr:O-antigen ligase family protein [Arenimonas sp.]